MNESLRELLYPLGFLSSLAFGGRFLLQWISSEIKQESTVSQTFWKLSLVGNIMLMVHSFIQIQYHVCLVQACNAVISWRNLNLMRNSSQQVSTQTVVLFLFLASSLTTLAFALQGYYALDGNNEWFRIPATPWQQSSRSIHQIWHWIGFIGIVLFASRFWIQWWCAEKHKASYLGKPFWWLSLTGDLLSLAYFVQISDAVNIIGPTIGLVPYIRNLMLIRKTQKLTDP